MARRKGNGKNAPDRLIEVQGNAAAVLCKGCGAPYLVSAFWDRAFATHWQGWRICPSCGETEATVWWSGVDGETGRAVYEADQRFLTPAELSAVASAKLVGIRKLPRLPRKRREETGRPTRWR